MLQDLYNSPELGVFELHDLCGLLTDDRLKVRSELEALEAAVRWADAEPEDRAECAEQLLRSLRLADLTPAQVRTTLARTVSVFEGFQLQIEMVWRLGRSFKAWLEDRVRKSSRFI